MKNKNILDLTEVGLENLNLVGGKNASLGEMIRNLSNLGIRIPGGFAITAHAYWEFLSFNNLKDTIGKIITDIDMNNLNALRKGACR